MASYADVLKGGLPSPSAPEPSAPSEPPLTYAQVAAKNTMSKVEYYGEDEYPPWTYNEDVDKPPLTMHALLEWSGWYLDEDGNEQGT